MPLIKAVKENRIDVAEFLIGSGIQPEMGDRLLHYAAENDSLPMLEILIPFYDLSKLEGEDSPLFEVKSLAVAEFLVKNGAKPDVTDSYGNYAYQTIHNSDAADFLHNLHREMMPAALVPVEEDGRIQWEDRFYTETITLSALTPVDFDRATGKFKLEYDGTTFRVTDRFLTSLSRMMKFSNNIFKYFSAEEVFARVYERNPDVRFQVTFDMQDKDVLGVVDVQKNILPAQYACRVLAEDPRIKDIHYSNGLWEARLSLNSEFNIRNDSNYAQELVVHYPVDGVSMPAIYLAVLRQVCSNGAVALVNSFKTEIEIGDNTGMHLSRLLRSFNNDNGFAALESRIQTAQETMASVAEFQKIENLLSSNIADSQAFLPLRTQLHQLAGDPCSHYGITSLNNIQPKRRALLPVGCSVNDLLNFCSELTTHHENILQKIKPFNAEIGKILSAEFDLEGMYFNQKSAKDFHLHDVVIDAETVEASHKRHRNTVEIA